MELEKILQVCDHTLLKPESTWEQIKAICDDGIKYHTASVCIPAAFVKQAKDYVPVYQNRIYTAIWAEEAAEETPANP